jgi:hypothetical protein
VHKPILRQAAIVAGRASTMKLNSFVPGTRERIAGYVYGTIVALAAVTAGASAYAHDLWRLMAIVGVSVLILWVAHVYAHGLGESLTLGRRLTGAELATIAGRELSIALAAVLPLAAIALGAIGVFDDRIAVWIALGIGVVGLAVQGVRYARLERLGLIATVVSVAVNVGLGLLIVAAKVIFAH